LKQGTGNRAKGCGQKGITTTNIKRKEIRGVVEIQILLVCRTLMNFHMEA
jgi:hypothetical protein